MKTRPGYHKENNKEIFLYSASYLLCHMSVLRYVLLLKIIVKFVDQFLLSKPLKQVSQHQVSTSDLLAPAPLSDVTASPWGSSTFRLWLLSFKDRFKSFITTAAMEHIALSVNLSVR